MSTNGTSSERDYWFPAKRYGWGWGFPSSWKGWAAFLCFFVACCVAFVFAASSLVTFVAIMLAATIGLVAVAYWKGEPPRWRWGD